MNFYCKITMITIVQLLCCTILTSGAPLIPLDGFNDNSDGGIFDLNQLDMLDMLFGPQGIITSMIQEGVKQMEPKQYEMLNKVMYLGEQPVQEHRYEPSTQIVPTIENSLSPDDQEAEVLINTLWQFLRHSKYGHPHFEELPPFGACDKHRCAQVYAQLDRLRRSQVFLDLQTFFALMQDEDGMKLIADLIEDPKQLESIQLPTVTSTTTQSNDLFAEHEKPKNKLMALWNSETPVFSFNIDEKVPQQKAVNAQELPPISLSIDGYDYNNDKYEDYTLVQSVKVPEHTINIPDVGKVLSSNFDDDKNLRDIFERFVVPAETEIQKPTTRRGRIVLLEQTTTTTPAPTELYDDIYYSFY